VGIRTNLVIQELSDSGIWECTRPFEFAADLPCEIPANTGAALLPFTVQAHTCADVLSEFSDDELA
jgi:hypothetical protein